MTNIVIAVTTADDTRVDAVAATLAVAASAEIRSVDARRNDLTAIMAALDHTDVRLAVIDNVRHSTLAWNITGRSDKPIVLTGSGVAPARIARILVPLDGQPDSAATVDETMRLFAATGIELVVLHVFDPKTVPSHWDQAAHARDGWEREFLARHCPLPGVTLRLHSGTPSEHVVAVAAEENSDLIVLTWSQRRVPGRAATVRHTVTAADQPIMLVPARPQ